MADRDEARRAELFRRLAETGSVEVRNELVESYAALAEFFANRYRQQASEPEDIRQVAQLALVKAVDRFDHTLGVNFSTFAGRTIDGELKRYFRDRTWSVRVPRSLQETALEVRAVIDTMTAANGRPPTVQDLAEETGYDTTRILQALDVQTAQRARSLDAPVGDETAATLAGTIGDEDDNIDRSETRMAVEALLEDLPERDRQILELRFFEELTQQQIADQLGISQMHVSRLLRASLETLRSRYRD